MIKAAVLTVLSLEEISFNFQKVYITKISNIGNRKHSLLHINVCINELGQKYQNLPHTVAFIHVCINSYTYSFIHIYHSSIHAELGLRPSVWYILVTS